MEKEQEREWAEAQNIEFSVDLVDAAKKQLEFLAAVDRNRHLYEGPALQWAIYRYNAFWLPLLAKHSEKPVSEESLVAPLDCEWIWHCHRLNPVRYKLDCEKLFGRILDSHNAISSIQGTSKNKTKEIWKTLYPEEPYELELNRHFSGDVLPESSRSETFTSYDLISAVTRQIPFSFQVSRPYMSHDLFLQEAVARYKGFLHLIRTNRKKNIRRFCVPTYDIDLIWHSHQRHPVSYCEDLTRLMGKVLEHDDTDSDRTKGKKLDTGFSETTKQWEETFGLRYWKAGAMYRGSAPTPVAHIPFPFSFEGKKFDTTHVCKNLTQIPAVEAVEVLLEFVEIKNLPKGHKGNVFVSFSKKQPDKIFNAKRTLSIFSESGEKQVAFFQCEPTGEFLFEIVSHLPSNIPKPKSFKLLGSCSLSVRELFASASRLSVDKWLSVVPVPVSGNASSQPILLHVSVSFTLPTPAPHVYHLMRTQPFFKSSCFFPLPGSRKSLHAKSWTHVIDDDGNDVIGLQMRNLSEDMRKNSPDLLKEVHYVTDSGETHTLAEFVGNEWCMKGNYKLRSSSGNNGDLFELVGDKMVKVFPGRRLNYEPKHCEKQRSEQDFVTAVEFSSDYPYGKAVALVDLRSGTFKVNDEWMVLPGITLAFILSDILKREGYNAFTARGNTKDVIITDLPGNTESKIRVQGEIVIKEAGNPVTLGISQSGVYENGCGSALTSGACGGCRAGGCGAGCGNAIKSGACGGCGAGGCGAGCGNAVKSGACGGCGAGGCGAGCGNAVKSGACGGCGAGGCGAGCGNAVKSGACGGCGAGGCGAGCGNAVKSGACGGCGAGGCGAGGCGTNCGGRFKSTADSGGCGSGAGCGNNLPHGKSTVGAIDIPKVESSMVNKPIAA